MQREEGAALGDASAAQCENLLRRASSFLAFVSAAVPSHLHLRLRFMVGALVAAPNLEHQEEACSAACHTR
jgi:hypothetical protein